MGGGCLWEKQSVVSLLGNTTLNLIPQSTDPAASGMYSESISWPVPGSCWALLETDFCLQDQPEPQLIHILMQRYYYTRLLKSLPTNSLCRPCAAFSFEGDACHIALAGICAAFFSIVAAWGGPLSLYH